MAKEVIKCFGCSFTNHGLTQWPTWVDFLKISSKSRYKVENYGLSGSANEYICRQILKKVDNNDTVVVMWSAFDRTHSQLYLEKQKSNQGKFLPEEQQVDKFGVTLQQLYERTLEYIWTANQFCKNKNIRIINLSMTILNMGESQKENNFKNHLDIDYSSWPIDLSSFCLENLPVFNVENDTHPTPSQAYRYHKEIICPILKLTRLY